MIGAIDQGHIGALVLLDLYAAFDTVDHQILAMFYDDGSELLEVHLIGS